MKTISTKLQKVVASNERAFHQVLSLRKRSTCFCNSKKPTNFVDNYVLFYLLYILTVILCYNLRINYYVQSV